jgi:transcription initiation factor IIE alpha subunit
MSLARWVSIIEMANIFRVSSERVRNVIVVLRDQKQIRWRKEPRDRRKIQVFFMDLEKVRIALGIGPISNLLSKLPERQPGEEDEEEDPPEGGE